MNARKEYIHSGTEKSKFDHSVWQIKFGLANSAQFGDSVQQYSFGNSVCNTVWQFSLVRQFSFANWFAKPFCPT
jgi:hypothetical protein